MARGILVSWIAQLTAVFVRPFQADGDANQAVIAAKVVMEPVGAVSPAVSHRSLARPLAVQMACQAKLNVPVGRKPRTAGIAAGKKAKSKPVRPVVAAAAAKRKPQARSVYLQARHVAVTPRPLLHSAAVIALPTKSKAARPATRANNGRCNRLAA